METMNRDTLSGKSMPELRQMIRLIGGDSQQGESKDSLISRILLFSPPQKWDVPIKIEPQKVEPQTEESLRCLLAKYLDIGMTLTINNGCWELEFNGNKDSGNLSLTAKAIERCADMLAKSPKTYHPKMAYRKDPHINPGDYPYIPKDSHA